MNTSRRHFLTLTGLAPLALVGFSSARADAPAACYDPATLPLSQKSRRRSLGYAEASVDPAKHCSACAFFTGTSAGCGTCAMLTGGAVNGGGVCNSFAAKR
jgi:uncharacterized protein (DUF1501 family)